MKYLEKYELYNQQICLDCLDKYLRNVKDSYIKESSDSQALDVRSISIAVPLKGCVNNCKFCCSKISKEEEELRGETYDDNHNDSDFEEKYFQKMKFVNDQGCRYAMLTGDGEPMQNPKFLEMFGRLNKRLPHPFQVEIQTTGVLLNDKTLLFLKDVVGLNLVSLSISDIFDDYNNASTIRMHKKLQFNLVDLCKKIKNYGFTLRLSLNLIKVYNKYRVEDVFEKIKEMQADQVTFRVLWEGDADNVISKWIKVNRVNETFIEQVENYLNENGRKVPAAYSRWTIGDISVVVDKDCMSESETDDIRYFILRSDCDLYTKWNQKSSVFKI